MLLLNTLAGTDEATYRREPRPKKGAGHTIAAQHIRRGSHEATNRSPQAAGSQRLSNFCGGAAWLQSLLISFA